MAARIRTKESTHNGGAGVPSFLGRLGNNWQVWGYLHLVGGLVFDECPLNLKLAVAVDTCRNLELLAALLDPSNKSQQECSEKQLPKWLPGESRMANGFAESAAVETGGKTHRRSAIPSRNPIWKNAKDRLWASQKRWRFSWNRSWIMVK